jgi:hypothetical protein
MEDAVAEAGQRADGEQHGVAVRRREQQRGQHEAGDAGEQHAARPDAVHDEAGQRLSHAGDDEEDRHHARRR